ncbi:MAG TPA: hypothetical protein VL294_04870 [Pseudolysinimonas sp.]|jgi:hypothetical protein|nr:hypothetical protein [Pseudolysinimonas sp.]
MLGPLSFWHIALVLLTLAALVGAIIVIVRRSRTPEAPGVENVGLLRLVAGLAVVAAALAAIGTLVGVVATAVGQAVPVEIPVATWAPQLPAGVTADGPTATIEDGTDHLALAVSGLSAGTRTLLAVGQLVGGAAFITIALLARRLARSAIAADAYRGVASRLLWIAAVTVLLGASVASLLTQLGGWRAGVEALQLTGWTGTGDDPGAMPAWPEPVFSLTFDFTPLLISLGLACIAVVLREGERLRLRAEAAEADVEGLV